MLSEFGNHTKETWSNALNGTATTGELVECAAGVAVGAALVLGAGKFGFLRAMRRGKALTAADDSLPTLELTSLGDEAVRLKTVSATSDEGWKQLHFNQKYEVQLQAGETGTALHERLRPQVIDNFRTVREPTIITTPSTLTFDASKILGIEGAGGVLTSLCKHELPYFTFVGVRKPGWMQMAWANITGTRGDHFWKYRMYPLGRELTQREKNLIYDVLG